MATTRKRVLLLGGGFAGLYAALHLEKTIARRDDVEVILVNRENFILFTPMLHEVAASDLDMTNIVNPLRKLLKRVHFFAGEVENINLERRTVSVHHGGERHGHELAYDYLLLAMGSVTNFFKLPGLQERSLTMKTLSDAIMLRNRIIANLEEANFECCASVRKRLLTFVVAGGGFAGVETIGSINTFARSVLRHYPNLPAEELRFILVHPGETILQELSPKLGAYAQKKLIEERIDVMCRCRVAGADNTGVRLVDGTVIETNTVVWTAGTSPNPLLEALPCAKDRGRIVVNEFLEVRDYPNVWALGDCACVPDPATGKPHPPTAQHAVREGKIAGRNIAAAITGGKKHPFTFRTLGQLASIGRRQGVANIMGINFSGFIAWWLWRTIYLMKLPRLEKKVRVAFDWTLDLFFSKDIVQFMPHRAAHSLKDTAPLPDMFSPAESTAPAS